MLYGVCLPRLPPPPPMSFRGFTWAEVTWEDTDVQLCRTGKRMSLCDCSTCVLCTDVLWEYIWTASERGEQKTKVIVFAGLSLKHCASLKQAQAWRIEVSKSSEVSFPGGQGWVEVELSGLPGVCPGCLPPGTSLGCPLSSAVDLSLRLLYTFLLKCAWQVHTQESELNKLV